MHGSDFVAVFVKVRKSLALPLHLHINFVNESFIVHLNDSPWLVRLLAIGFDPVVVRRVSLLSG